MIQKGLGIVYKTETHRVMKFGLSAIVVIANDIHESIKFYRLLGLNVPDYKEHDTHVDCIQESGFIISLVPEHTVMLHRPNWKGSTGTRVTLQFWCSNQNEVDVTYTRLINEGYRTSELPHDGGWGERYAQVFDPDGNIIALFSVLDMLAL